MTHGDEVREIVEEMRSYERRDDCADGFERGFDRGFHAGLQKYAEKLEKVLDD